MFNTKPVWVMVILTTLLTLPTFGSAQSSLRNKVITPLGITENGEMQRQRRIINRLIRENFGSVRLSGTKSDLYYFQRIIEKRLIAKNEVYDLQALGVMLGDVMARSMPLKWVVVKDRYGKSRALQHEGTDQLFFPLTMISRRVQNGMQVSVSQLYDKTEAAVKKRTYRKSKYQQVPTSSS